MLYLEQDELLTKKGFLLIDDNPSLVKFQEALVQSCSDKKSVLRNFAKIYRKTPAPESLF